METLTELDMLLHEAALTNEIAQADAMAQDAHEMALFDAITQEEWEEWERGGGRVIPWYSNELPF